MLQKCQSTLKSVAQEKLLPFFMSCHKNKTGNQLHEANIKQRTKQLNGICVFSEYTFRRHFKSIRKKGILLGENN